MHSTKLSSSSTTKPSATTTTTTNIEQYHYPPISTLRRASRPSNIDLSIFDHNNTQSSSNDPGIYSAPIFYIKQTNNNHYHHHQQQHQQQQQHIPQTSQPYTTTFQFQPQQHLQLSPHHQSQQEHNIHLYQQQQIVDPFSEHQHTPRTFPLQTSPNHYRQCFYFPPSTLQVNMTNNGHQSTNASQPSTPTHNNHIRSVQIQEPSQQQWSNPVLSSLIVKRMNENRASMTIDDDEDPSASIDALVADDDSNSHDLLDDEQNKSMNQSKTSSTIPPGTISPSSHLYLRSKSHILTTPPNPLASDDHPDNQLTVGNTFKKTFSPISSAGFELTTTTANNNNNNNNNGKISSSNTTKGTSRFNFDTNILEQKELKKNQHNENLIDDNEETNHDLITKPLIINTDVRTTRISSNSLIQDDNSNHSSTNSSSQNTSSRIFGQMLKSSEQQILSSSSPISNDIKLSSLDHDTNFNSISLQQQNRHYCAHPDCNKTFTNKSALAKHKLTHSQDRKHVCAKCNKGFKRLDHLNGHMLTHEEEKPHKCRVPNCNRTYCDARSLKRHIENTHQDILAAIHEGKHNEYKKYLPETAFVKTKDLSINNEFSIDSVDSNSPRSLIDNEQSFNIRTSTGTKTLTTYTFDEQKYVDCQICKKSFKNGAALNGHMRLHGGFIDKPVPSSTDNTEKKKRITTPIKRKRVNSPSVSIKIKKEKQDSSMISSTNNLYQQKSSFISLSSCPNVIPKHLYDQTSLSPTRPASLSPSNIPISTSTFPQFTIKNPLSVQSTTKQNRKTNPLSTQDFHPSRINIQNVIIPHDPVINPQIYLTTSSPLQSYEDKIKESLSTENFSQHLQANGIPLHQTYLRTSPYQSSSHISQYSINSSSSSSFPTNPIAPSLFYHFIPNVERLTPDFCLQQQTSSPLNEPIHYSPSPNFGHIAVPNSNPLIINTPITSPYSNQYLSHNSPKSPDQKCNKNNNSMQLSPTTHSTSSSCSSLSSLNIVAPEKQIQNTMKQEIQDDKQQINIENQTSPLAVLEIVPDIDSPIKKTSISGFLIGTPSSTSTSSASSSSTSNNTHFNYDDVPQRKKPEPTPSSFYWPSQLRRQLSLNQTNKILNPLPSTPYTPPPMLSPFRKGPGLYYRVFSQPGTSTEPSSIPATPLPPSTPIGEESAGPKINIGKDYQAIIPKYRTKFDDNDDEVITDELLFSSSELSYLDEKSLEKFEQLNRMNPFLFSPRQSPKSYSLELIYMLLHEYNGDLPRTLAALLEGTVNDIKQCRPLHSYHFLDCDKWTKEEIDAFTKAMQTSEKNFQSISRAVGTKSIKQCIEFHYMPKISKTARKIVSARTSCVMTRRKRYQIIKAKQQFDDEISSSSSFNEFRLDDDGGSTVNSDSSPAAQFSCDIDECSQTFTTDRACRAHRNSHRRTNNNMTSWTTTKRSRHID